MTQRHCKELVKGIAELGDWRCIVCRSQGVPMTETEEIGETVTETEDCLSDLIDALSDDPSVAADSSDANSSTASLDAMPEVNTSPASLQS